MEDFLKDGCADKLLAMIEAKKHDCAALYKKMAVTPEQAAAKAVGKAQKCRQGKKAAVMHDPQAVKENATKDSRDAKKKLAELSQELVRELVKAVEDEGMLKDAVSTGKDHPATRPPSPRLRLEI